MNNKYSEQAMKWKCSNRTIARWIKAGAPLDDDEKMRTWLASRRIIPNGTMNVQLSQSSDTTPKTEQPTESATIPGLAANLRRLEQMEVKAFDNYQRVRATGTPIEAKTARREWIELSGALRKTDEALAEARRDAGELVPRTELEAILERLIYMIHVSAHQISNTMESEAYRHGERVSYQIFKEALDNRWLGALARMTGGCPAFDIPQWAIDAMFRGAAATKGQAIVPWLRAAAFQLQLLDKATIEKAFPKEGI